MKQGSSIRVIHGPYPEFTWVAVLVGWAIGAVLTFSIAYASLKLGFSIEGSELAAILGWGILRGVMKRTSIVENNINQTIASAVNGASSGIMFSVPALLILARNSDKPEFAELANIDLPLLILASITGCIVGLCFVIPLRKQMIDFDRLPYPGGIAVATILKSPGAGVRKAIILLSGVALAMAVQISVLRFLGEDANWELGEQAGWPSLLNISLSLSIMTIGVGYLSGKGGFWFGAGGFLCYFLISPLLNTGFLSTWVDPQVTELTASPGQIRNLLYKPTGIGMLIGAAIGGIIGAAPMMLSAMKAMAGSRQRAGGDVATKDEMPISLLYSMIILGLLLMVGFAWKSGNGEVPLWRAGLLAGVGVLWIWIAGVIVSECIGRTNWSPLSGMTLIAVTILIFVLKDGTSSTTTIRVSMMVGAAVCLAISQASDMMLDLKSGYLVGGVPRRQQIAQMIGTWLGPIIVVLMMIVLHKTMVMGSEKLPAPQAEALASTMQAIVDGNAPVYRYSAGAGLGLMLALSGLGGIGVLVGLGFYMPFNIVLTYTIGNILRVISDGTTGKNFGHEVGVPFAAGLIVGEALTNVGNAVYQVVIKDLLG